MVSVVTAALLASRFNLSTRLGLQRGINAPAKSLPPQQV
jgi:hypothetical protein